MYSWSVEDGAAIMAEEAQMGMGKKRIAWRQRERKMRKKRLRQPFQGRDM